MNVPRKLIPLVLSCAGLAALSLRQKLDVCEKLGLSPVAALALLQDLDTVTQDRLVLLDTSIHQCFSNEVLLPLIFVHLQTYSGGRHI